jgi:hypothetical protein
MCRPFAYASSSPVPPTKCSTLVIQISSKSPDSSICWTHIMVNFTSTTFSPRSKQHNSLSHSIDIHIHTCIHTYMCRCAQVYTYTRARTVHACVYGCVHVHFGVCAYIHLLTQKIRYVCTTYLPKCAHTHTHTHTHILCKLQIMHEVMYTQLLGTMCTCFAFLISGIKKLSDTNVVPHFTKLSAWIQFLQCVHAPPYLQR